MRKYLSLLISIAILVSLLIVSQAGLAWEWRPVRGGIAFGISGMALVQQQNDTLDFLIVHDNKQKDQSRLAIISIKRNDPPQYFPVQWPNVNDLPVDLEGLTAIPKTENSSFMAFSSLGKIYQISLDKNKKTIALLKVFTLPNIPEKSNFEGFSLQEIDGKILTAWAHRGEGEDPAKLYWGTLDLVTDRIQPQGSIEVKVPWPNSQYVRHISDLKIDKAGILFISSATDSGNDGPFESAIYVAGAFKLSGNRFEFRLNPELTPLDRYNYHKIEGLELVPGAAGGLVFGTDDENMGSSVYLNSVD